MKLKILSPKEQLKYKKLYLKMQNRKGFLENVANEEQLLANLSTEDQREFKKLLIKK